MTTKLLPSLTLLIAALLLLSPFVLSQSSSAAERPNILVILADDLGHGDVQSNNPERGKIPTPHIDKLASRGVRLSQQSPSLFP